LNSTETVQLAPDVRELPQVFALIRKELAFVPVMDSEVSFTVAVPVFLIVTTCAAVADPKFVEAKVMLAGEGAISNAPALVGQAFTRFATLKLPRPVVRSYPVVAE
jgi:hypothetical protein